MKIYIIENNEGDFWSEENSSFCHLISESVYWLYLTGIKEFAEHTCNAINIRAGEKDYCKVVCFELVKAGKE